MQLVGNPRRFEDSFRTARRRRTDEELRREAIAALDSQGAAVHVAAESFARGEASSSVLTRFLASLALRAIRIELDGVTVELHSTPIDGVSYCYAIHSQCFLVKEGFLEGTGRTAGLVGAIILGLLDAFRRVEASFNKVCSIKGFCLQLATTSGQPVPAFSAVGFIPSFSQDPCTDFMKESVRDPDISNKRSGCILFWKTVLLIAKFCDTQLNGMDADIPETALQFNFAELEVLLLIASQLQGLPSKAVKDGELSHHANRGQDQWTSQRVRYLWHKAVERLIGSSWRSRLKDAVDARVLRHRYARVYASWLREAGWGCSDRLTDGHGRSMQRKKSVLKVLENELFLMEQDLPVEAITLARSVARCKLTAATREHGTTATLRSVKRWEIYLSPVLSALERLMKCLFFIFCWFYGLMCKYAKQTAARLSVFIPKSLFIAQFHQDETLHITDEHSDFLYKCKDTKPSIVKGTVCFSCRFGTGHSIFTGSPNTLSGEEGLFDLKKSDNKTAVEWSGKETLPAIRFTWETLCLAYQSNPSTLGLELVCGYVEGEVLSAISSCAPKSSDQFCKGNRKWVLKHDDAVKFLISGRAPQLAISEKAKEYVKNEDFYGRSFLNKRQIMGSGTRGVDLHGTSANISTEGDRRPFLLFEVQISQADSRALDLGAVRCVLAVGCVDCRLDRRSFSCVASLLMQFLEICSVHKHSTEGEDCPLSVATSMEVSWKSTNNGWEALCADWIKHIISVVVFKRELWLSAAVESPKLQLSVITQGVREVQAAVQSSKGSVLVLCLGLLEATVWPAQAEKYDGASSAKRQVKDTKIWLRKPPSPQFLGESFFETCYEHEQIGNNVILTLQGAALTLQVLSGNQNGCPLVEPEKMTWEISLCRDHYVSLFAMSDIVSAAAVGSFSAIPIHLYLDEIEILFEVARIFYKDLEHLSFFDHKHRGIFYNKMPGSVYQKPLDCQVQSQTDGCFSLSGPRNHGTLLMSRGPLPLYFALSVRMQIESVNCVLGIRRLNEAIGASQSAVAQGNIGMKKDLRVLKEFQQEKLVCVNLREVNASQSPAMHGKIIYIVSEELWSQFSWGDGCQLCIGAGLRKASTTVRNLQSESMNAFDAFRDLRFKDSFLELANDEAGRAQLLCELCIEQLSYSMTSPWYSFEGIDDLNKEGNSMSRGMHVLNAALSKTKLVSAKPGGHLTLGRQESVGQGKTVWFVADLEVGKLHLTDSALDRLINKDSFRVMHTRSLSIGITMDKGFESIAVISKGGTLVLHAQALTILARQIGYFSLSLRNIYSKNGTTDGVLMSSAYEQISHDGSALRQHHLGKSLSLPLCDASNSIPKYRRLESAPIRLCVGEQETNLRGLTYLIGGFSCEVSGLCVVLAHTNTTFQGGEPAEGVLLEIDAVTRLKKSEERRSAYFEITQFLMYSLPSGGQFRRQGQDNHSLRYPKFGTNLVPGLGVAKAPVTLDDSSSSMSGACPFPTSEMKITESKQSPWESIHDDIVSSSEFGGIGTEVAKGYILENPKVCCLLENNFNERDSELSWLDGWKGGCSFSGIDIAITTSEIQLLLALFSSFSDLSTSYSSTSEKSFRIQVNNMQQMSDHGCEVPDGSIVAVKDVREHLYLAVEKVDDHYRLIGVLHYSLVGDRALFKVKYQKPGMSFSESSFSLISMSAKDADGKLFRVHYRPGSGLADIASTHDGSWELWQPISYKYSTNEDTRDLGFSSDLDGKLVYLVNQKSKQGMTLASGAPMMVKKPGNPFKFKILRLPDAKEGTLAQTALKFGSINDQSSLEKPANLFVSIPEVDLKVESITLTLLHETGGKSFLPLLRTRLENVRAVMHIQSCKVRLIGEYKILLEYLEANSNQWSIVMQPVDIELFFQWRAAANVQAKNKRSKAVASFFARFKRIDIIICELSLDMILFVIGALNVAGPYTVRHSPLLANSCLVENQTGLDLCCSMDDESQKQLAKIPAWTIDSFLVRNMASRRDSWPEKVSSSISLYLEKTGSGLSSPIHVSLAEPGVTAVRTHLEDKEGLRRVSGPVVVVDVSKQGQDGITVTVSPMVRIQNASGLPVEIRCRRANRDGEGAVVLLEDGDVIDDSMGAFDAMCLTGEQRKALSSFNLGNYLLSVRPMSVSLPDSVRTSQVEKDNETLFEWSEDIKGEKAIRVSGFLEKLQYGLKKTLKGRNLASSFGTIYCSTRATAHDKGDNSLYSRGVYMCIRSTRRMVSLTSISSQDTTEVSRSVITWQEQQELVLLPTIHVYNFLQMQISITFGKGEKELDSEVHIEQGGRASLYVDLENLFLSLKIEDPRLRSKPVSIGDWKMNSQKDMAAAHNGGLKELEIVLDFGDTVHFAKLKVVRGNDGVLQVIVYTQHALKNNSDTVLLCCALKCSMSRWGGIVPWNKRTKIQWPPGEHGILLQAGSKVSWLERSCHLFLRMQDKTCEAAGLDLESFSGSTELTLPIRHEAGMTEHLQLGVTIDLPSAGDLDPTHTILILPRYVVVNESQEAIFVCQDGFQEDENAPILLRVGERVAFKTQSFAGQGRSQVIQAHYVGSGTVENSILSLRFRVKENGWNWSGPICASALGSFTLRICRSSESFKDGESKTSGDNDAKFKFVAIHVEEHNPSLVVRFCVQSADTIPYRIKNSLTRAAILFHQKGLSASEMLEPGHSVGYAWDNLSLPHKLVVRVAGTQFCKEINLDKLGPWRSFRVVRYNKGFALQLPFYNQLGATGEYQSDGNEDPLESRNLGYEVRADGPRRVLWVCEDINSKLNEWQPHVLFPSARMDLKVPALAVTLVELVKQKREESHAQSPEDLVGMSPLLCMRMSSFLVELLSTDNDTFFQIKVQTLSIDEKWQGAPFGAMLRVHSEDRFEKDEIVLHMAAVLSKHLSNPNHVKYLSVLLQAIDLNLDEETLMKLVPFYRYSLAESTSSRQIYFEHFEIHPIKIVASFLPGQALSDYTSAQETLRSLLHSFVKVPSIRARTVELNGVLLSHALFSFRQLAIKCAQHYSWYAMRAVYIAKGSKLLPPAFASLFDDSAASSLDVFFDPANGSIDMQGLTIGMFNLLRKGLNKRGYSGTSRYIGDLEHMMKAAGSNIIFAVLTEVSDNVLKGAETGGVDGMVNGFRRGILNVAMEPSALRVAVGKGSASRRIKLDHSAGVDETYIEGYLQAMLDTLFKQDYLRVKVVDDQVLLKNLPPNSMLIEDIIRCVKNFLIGEGLLAGETSAAATHSLRRLHRDNERQFGPAVLALCEQLFVIFAVRALRNQAKSWLHWGVGDSTRNDETTGVHSKLENNTVVNQKSDSAHQNKHSIKRVLGSFVLSSAMAYLDGRLCRHIPNTLARRIVSGFLLSFVE